MPSPSSSLRPRRPLQCSKLLIGIEAPLPCYDFDVISCGDDGSSKKMTTSPPRSSRWHVGYSNHEEVSRFRYEVLTRRRPMALSVLSPPPAASSLSCRSSHCLRASPSGFHHLLLLGSWTASPLSCSSNINYCSTATRASGDDRGAVGSNPRLLDEELLRRVSGAKDADEALGMIEEARGSGHPGVIETEDCHSIIESAFDRGDADLALSVFYAMRAGFDRGGSSFP
ncbi:hypothetical protein GW17_00009594 [Ensete ventricosum]|nr:hypothetical protein GW17_00009594 [Ensete ventricosum]